MVSTPSPETSNLIKRTNPRRPSFKTLIKSPSTAKLKEKVKQQQSSPLNEEISSEPSLLEPNQQHDNVRPSPFDHSSDRSKDVIIPNFCPVSSCFPRQPLLRMNHNVLLCLLLDILYGVAESVWFGTVDVAYLKHWGGGRTYLVGNMEALNGLATLISALPVGYLADKYGRSRAIRFGAILFAVTALAHITLIHWIGSTTLLTESKAQAGASLTFMSIIMILWGIGSGIVVGPCDALYADSTPAGDRSRFYQYSFICYLLASCCGPLLAIVLFQTLGDDWSLEHLQTVMYVGLGMEFSIAFIMLFFDDRKALDESERGHDDDDDDDTDEEEKSLNGHREVPIASKQEFGSNGGTDEEKQFLLPHNDTGNSEVSAEDLRRRQRLVPYILFSASLATAMGSGLTVMFFPLFFKDQVGLTPTQVQLIYFLEPLIIAMFSSFATPASSWFGRVQTILILSSCGVACLLAMVLAFDTYFVGHFVPLIGLYLLNTACMDCTEPLEESILMDFVPKRHRARWKSLESIAGFGWCGSAAIGGFIIDRWSFTHALGATAALQIVGLILLTGLLPLVPRRESEMSRTKSASTMNSETKTCSS
jgi:MFS family permease